MKQSFRRSGGGIIVCGGSVRTLGGILRRFGGMSRREKDLENRNRFTIEKEAGTNHMIFVT
jgi:hypothetical protein